jgi:hypothetical protein
MGLHWSTHVIVHDLAGDDGRSQSEEESNLHSELYREALWCLEICIEQSGVAMAEGSIEVSSWGRRQGGDVAPKAMAGKAIGYDGRVLQTLLCLHYSCNYLHLHPSRSISFYLYTGISSMVPCRIHVYLICQAHKRSHDPLSPCFRRSAGKVRNSSASVAVPFDSADHGARLSAGKYTLVSVDSTLRPARALPEAGRHNLTAPSPFSSVPANTRTPPLEYCGTVQPPALVPNFQNIHSNNYLPSSKHAFQGHRRHLRYQKHGTGP